MTIKIYFRVAQERLRRNTNREDVSEKIEIDTVVGEQRDIHK